MAGDLVYRSLCRVNWILKWRKPWRRSSGYGVANSSVDEASYQTDFNQYFFTYVKFQFLILYFSCNILLLYLNFLVMYFLRSLILLSPYCQPQFAFFIASVTFFTSCRYGKWPIHQTSTFFLSTFLINYSLYANTL